jgi:hypothetical protein
MIHQINLENIQITTFQIQKTKTNLKPLLYTANSQSDTSRKSLLKIYKANKQIEDELKHLINFLDNNLDAQIKEFNEFKTEICVTGIRNKSSQITCLLNNNDE